MAAHPPFRERRRARPGSLDRPVNSRMYRGTWLLVGIPLLIAAFTVFHPQPLPAPTLQPDFDGATARLTAEQFANNNPDPCSRHAGRSPSGELGRSTARPVRPGARSRAFSRENPRPRERRAGEPDRGAPGPIEPADRGRRASRQHRREPWSEQQRVGNGSTARAGPLVRNSAGAAASAAAESLDSLPLQRCRLVRRPRRRALHHALPLSRPRRRGRRPRLDRRRRPSAHRLLRRHVEIRLARRSFGPPRRGSPTRPVSSQPGRARSRSCSTWPSRSACTSRRRSSRTA